MPKYNAESRRPSFSRQDTATDTSGANSSGEEDFSFEESFRGFEKVPAVHIERLDLSQYIDSLKNEINGNKPESIPPNNSEKLSQFIQECSVRVVRSSLSELQDMLAKNTRMNKENIANGGNKLNFNCKICAKSYSSEKRLQKHQENKHLLDYKPQKKPPKRVSFSDHVIIHEVKEYHHCRKCPKIFENYTTLKIHMRQKHKKRKCYICNYCSKKFVDRMFFKVHIKLHCEMCGQLLPNKRKLMEHRRTICKVLKKYTCKTCDESYFSYMDLKDHTFGHSGTVFVCNACKDQFKTKCQVAHHIKFLHSKRRPRSLYNTQILDSKKLYLCNFCDETSYERNVIENHISTLPELRKKTKKPKTDLYPCDHCQAKYDSEKEMLQHKWTHFLISMDNTQERPKPKSKKRVNFIYKVGDPLPEYFKPKLVLDKINIGGKVIEEPLNFVKVKNVVNGEIKKAVVDPISKKTIISKHRCETCNKYYSSNYCLNRHIATKHNKMESYQCNICEEPFAWSSLLYSHKCICANVPEMPFNDARPEIQLEGIPNYIDDFNMTDDNYMNSVDFEIPAPIVELTEYDDYHVVTDVPSGKICAVPTYKVVMQEVPIEF